MGYLPYQPGFLLSTVCVWMMGIWRNPVRIGTWTRQFYLLLSDWTGLLLGHLLKKGRLVKGTQNKSSGTMPCKLFPFSSKTLGGWDKHDQQIRTSKNWGTIISINRLLLEWLHLFILLLWGSLSVHFTFCWHPGVGITWSYRYSLAALTVELVSFWYVLVGSMLELMLKLYMHYTWVFSYRRAQLGFQLQTQIAGTKKSHEWECRYLS